MRVGVSFSPFAVVASPLPGFFGLHPIRLRKAPPQRIGWRVAKAGALRLPVAGREACATQTASREHFLHWKMLACAWIQGSKPTATGSGTGQPDRRFGG